MDSLLPDLYPNPGWSNTQIDERSDTSALIPTAMLGKHCILELFDCDQAKLNDEAFIRTTITAATKIAGATLINLITHKFKPQGVTGLALLAESHISIHTWPEKGYGAVDIFTCGDHTMPEHACQIICQELDAISYSLKSLRREPPTSLKNIVRSPNYT